MDTQPRGPPASVALLGSRGIPARYGGFETLVEVLAAHLPGLGYQTTVFCESSLRKFPPVIPGVRCIYFPVFEKLRIVSETLYDVVSLIWSSFASMDVVILFGYTASVFCAIPRLFGRFVLINVDGLEWKRGKFPRPIRFLLRLAELMATKSATAIICDSRAIQDYYRRRYHVDTQYAPNPASTTDDLRSKFLNKLGLKPGQYYLAVARLEPENHIDMIISGFQRSGTSKKLVIVGPLTKSRYVRHLLQMRTENILFVGGIYDRAALSSLRSESFAYIHGHEVGGTNPSLLESMSRATPIIALDVAFNREVAKKAGLYFRSQEELTEKLRRLESDPKSRKRMGSEARRIVQHEYSVAKVASRYADVVNTLMALRH